MQVDNHNDILAQYVDNFSKVVAKLGASANWAKNQAFRAKLEIDLRKGFCDESFFFSWLLLPRSNFTDVKPQRGIELSVSQNPFY